MIFTCDKNKISASVGIVQRAVSAKSSLQALEGIHIEAFSSSVKLTAYDLEIGMFTEIPAEIKEPGEIILNAKILSEILRKLPSEKVEIKSNQKFLTTVSSGASEFTILGIPPSEFPEIPAVKDTTSFLIPQNLLADMIRQTLFSVSTDDSKPVHTGSLFELSKDKIRIISVDGYRLAIRTDKLKNDKDLRFVVPGKTLGETLKMLSADSDDPVKLSLGNRHVLFELNGYSIISRLLEGEFIDYRAVIKGNCTASAKIGVKNFTDSIERASLLISDRLKSPVRCNFGPDKLKVTCSTSIGRVYDETPVTLSGEPLEIGFNNRYLLDALHAAECDEIRLEFGGPLSPMKILPLDGDSFLFLVLPVRLSANA